MADAKMAQDHEHPSGLRDAMREAIQRGLEQYERESHGPDDPPRGDYVYYELEGWLTHEPADVMTRLGLTAVSEGEIEAAASAIHREEVSDWPAEQSSWGTLLAFHKNGYRRKAAAALAASRRVLVPRIESDAGTESGDIGGPT